MEKTLDEKLEDREIVSVRKGDLLAMLYDSDQLVVYGRKPTKSDPETVGRWKNCVPSVKFDLRNFELHYWNGKDAGSGYSIPSLSDRHRPKLLSQGIELLKNAGIKLPEKPKGYLEFKPLIEQVITHIPVKFNRLKEYLVGEGKRFSFKKAWIKEASDNKKATGHVALVTPFEYDSDKEPSFLEIYIFDMAKYGSWKESREPEKEQPSFPDDKSVFKVSYGFGNDGNESKERLHLTEVSYKDIPFERKHILLGVEPSLLEKIKEVAPIPVWERNVKKAYERVRKHPHSVNLDVLMREEDL